MTPTEFLRMMWPDVGHYAIATPFRLPGTDTTVYAHKVFDTIDAAGAFAEAQRAQSDIFYCVHTLRAPRVWNPAKVDRKTGEPGAYEVRVQRNMFAARCFFFDMDIGPQEEKYPTREDAVAALIQFCRTTRLPKPMLVSSGRGLHVYWRMTDPLLSDAWKAQAMVLRRLATTYGLRVDPMRTTDTASVLRVAGTLHLKDRENPLKVKVLQEGVESTPEDLQEALQRATIIAGVEMPATPLPGRPAPAADELGSNTDKVYDTPPVSMQALGKACAQVRHFVKTRGAASEPAWYAMIQLLRHVEDGQAWAHKISTGGFAAAIDAKFDQLAAKDMGPTTCAVMAERCGEALCASCPHFGKIRAPVVAARMRDPAPAPQVAPLTVTDVAVQLPPPPSPFIRLKSGGIGVTTTNASGEEISVVIYDHDIYPLKRILDADRGIEQQVWRAHLPRNVTTDFVIDASALYKTDVLATALANNGVYARPSRIREMQEYMSAYISELQKAQDASSSFNTLGWHDDFMSFVLPDKVLHRDGRVVPTQLTSHAESSSHAISKAGTLERQVELMRFYTDPQYRPHQFLVLGSLAAPLFHMTGHHGVVINATGDPGASKSTSLYTAAAIWAHPSKFPLNGTNHGATQKARAQRMVTMGSMPVCVDEITTMGFRDAQELVMNVTQPEGRLALTREGKERRTPAGEKSTIMLCTANNSLHGLLSYENSAGTAGSMRVVEIRMRAGRVHQKHQADTYLHQLRENYGHIGEVFMAHVVANYDATVRRVRAKVVQIDAEAKIESSERFWSAAIAAILVAGEIAGELGLIRFDTAALHRWAVEDQIPAMRNVVAAEYGSALTTLTDYMEIISGNIMVMNKATSGPYVLRAPAGALLAQLDKDTQMLAVLKKGFKDYCARIGADITKILDELHALDLTGDGKPMRIVPVLDGRRILGRGTEYAKGLSRCFVVDLTHPEIAGSAAMTVVSKATETPKASART